MRIQSLIASSLFVIAFAAGQAGAQVTDGSAANHVFAQFADGRFSDSTFYRSTVTVSSDSQASVTCTANLFGLSVTGFGNGVTRTFNIAPEGWNIYKSPGTQNFQNGYMTLSCSAPVTAQVLYTFYAASGFVFSEATVFSSPAATIAQLLADQRSGSQLGIAVVNNSTVTKDFVIIALDPSLNQIGSATVTMGGRTQIARFLSELIAVPADYVGQVQIYTDTDNTLDVYAIGLKFTGSAFTTIPTSIRTR